MTCPHSLRLPCLSNIYFPHNVQQVTGIVSDLQPSICSLNNFFPLRERALTSTKERKHDKIHRPVTTPWLECSLCRHIIGRYHIPFVLLLIQGKFFFLLQGPFWDNSILNKYMCPMFQCYTTVSANPQPGLKLKKTYQAPALSAV